MSEPLDVVYEMQCDDCESVFEVYTTESNEHEPMYCTFCGNEIIVEDVYEDDDKEPTFDDEMDELKNMFKEDE